jgi:hypothetical protein
MTPDREAHGLELALAGATATVMIAHQVAAKAARDSLFLTHFDVTALPAMMIAGALTSAAAVLVMARALSRHGPARLIPPIFALSGVLFLVEWLAMGVEPRLVTVAYYLHISVLGSILISGFWSIINERYDPYRAKQAITRLAAASTLGGLLGGLAASAVAAFSDARGILVMLAGMHLFCGLALARVARGSPRQTAQGAPVLAQVVGPFRRNPLIRRMALLVLLVATNAALLDYLLKSAAAAELQGDELVHFFSSFYVAVGLGGFLLQTFVGNRALRWLGIGGTMAALPATVLVGGLGTFLLRHLMAVTVLRAGAAMLNNSFFRAGFESLYTPIPAGDKRAGKLLIDVGADRSGDLVGSLLIMGILLFPALTEDLLVAAVSVIAIMILVLILLLQRGYVAQLASNLRDGSQRAEDILAADATTRHTIAMTTQTAVSRSDLLREIARVRAQASNLAREADTDGAPGLPIPLPSREMTDPVVAAIADLRSGEAARIERVLMAETVTPELLPHVIPLLGRGEVLRDVFRALRPLASIASGQLVDALLDRRVHPLVRRRLPLILARADTSRAVQGLAECLEDEDPDVRLRCGDALNRIRSDHPELALPTGECWHAARAELARLHARGDQPPSPDALQHLFHLLGVLYTPDSLDLCYRSLLGEDPGLRGTALEYLENLLPQDVREALWPLIGAAGGGGGAGRPLQDIALDLLRAGSLPRRLIRKGTETRAKSQPHEGAAH